MKKFLEFLYLAFSENGMPSAKRVCGAIIIVVVMACTVVSIAKEGMTIMNQSIIETEIITGGALLGLSSITNIWANKRTDGTVTPKARKTTKKETEE
jgi:hypothetical protein